MNPFLRSKHINRVGSDPFVKACLIGYTCNLMGKVDMSGEFLWLLLRFLPPAQREQLCAWMKAHLKVKDYRGRFLNNAAHLSECTDELCCEIEQGSFTFSPKEFEGHLFALFSAWARRAKGRTAGIQLPELRQLQAIFDLVAGERELVRLLYCIDVVKHFGAVFDTARVTEFVRIASAATHIPFETVRSMLAHKSPLVQKGVVVYQSERGDHRYKLSEAVVDFLSGIADIPLKERFLREEAARPYALSSFNVTEPAGAIIRALLRSGKPCHILLYGRPGTGKTEYARAVVNSAGGRPCFFQRRPPSTDKRSAEQSELVTLRAAMHLLPEDGVLIVDEADSILNTRYFMFGNDRAPDKGQLNDLLDHCPVRILWITNDSQCIEESTLRRFAYSLKFKGFSRAERERIWKDLVGRHPLREQIPATLVRELAAGYPCNAAGIASALETLTAVVPKPAAGTPAVKDTLEELLRRHTEAIGRQPVAPLNLLTDRYDLDALNLDTPPAPVIAALRSFAEFRQANRRAEGHVNLLFWGKPGTGKTEMAKYLAAQLSADLILKRASDLVSMWVGQTEQNIRDAFEEAGRDDAILFIDEADSFFINRQTAMRSWEVSQTNELLTQMENHKGILICCTNLLEHLDQAVLRRFAWKIQFKPLTAEGRLRVFSRFFPDSALEDEDHRRLSAIADLTPGQIKAVWQKHRFVAADRTHTGAILSALENEARYERNDSPAIGFGR